MPITDLGHRGTGGRALGLSEKAWAKAPGQSVVRETVTAVLWSQEDLDQGVI